MKDPLKPKSQSISMYDTNLNNLLKKKKKKKSKETFRLSECWLDIWWYWGIIINVLMF